MSRRTALSRLARAAAALLLATLAPSARAAPPDAAASPPFFTDEAVAAGLDFVHVHGARGAFYFPEIAGAGGALLDYDGDGDLDVFLVQGGTLGEPAVPSPSDRLYRNDLEVLPDGSRRLRFTDVTAEAGLAGESGYGMGAAAGDYDGDGRVDLYVTNFGANALWRNRGDGRFEEVAAAAGADDPRWSVPATFFDADGDGRLDLFVGNYVDFSLARNIPCPGNTGLRDYCGPQSYQPVPDRLLLNRGRGADGVVRFEDVTARAGLDAAYGPALGVVASDVDGDGRTDLYVANDGAANQLWRNLGPGADGVVRFADESLLRGVALNAEGKAEAGMGIAVGDPDADGDEDFLVTHLVRETNTLYLNDGDGMFLDRTAASGLGPPSWPMTGFGAGWIDADNDGRLDLLVTNGAVFARPELRAAGDPWPYEEPGQLFLAAAPGPGGVPRFEEAPGPAGPALSAPATGRGALFGDLDDDGDLDVVVTQDGGPVRLLVNRVGQAAAWIGLALDPGGTSEAPRTEIGARVEVRPAGGPPVVRRVRRDGSYASSNDPRVLVGLGERRGAADVRVRWPDGFEERWTGLATGRYHRLVRGGGEETRQ